MNKVLIQDYISMSWRNFHDKHEKKNLDDFIDSIPELEFDESHLAHRDLEALEQEGDRNKSISSIRRNLNDKDFSAEYIDDYMNALESTKPESFMLKRIKDDILRYFQYDNRPIKIKDLRQELSSSNISTVSVDKNTRNLLNQQLKLYIDQNTPYTKGLVSLLDKLQPKQKMGMSRIGRKISAITNIDPKDREEREELYAFYEERYGLFMEIKKTIKEVLVLWDKVEEIDGQFQTRDTEEYIEDLDEDLDKLREIYNEMDDSLNYIIKTKAVAYPIVTDRETKIGQNVKNMVIEKLRFILGKEGIQHLEEELEDEPEWDEFGEQDTGTYKVKEGDETKDTSQDERADKITFDQREQESEMDRAIEDFLDTAEEIDTIEKVDPLFAVAAHQGIVKKKYSIASWEKTRDALIEQIDIAEKINPGVVYQYKEILDEHEEYQRQAVDTNREMFYLPAAENVSKVLDSYADIKNNYGEIERFHLKLVKIIIDLLEDSYEKTTLPIHTQLEDFAPGVEGRKQKIPRQQADRMRRQFNLMTTIKVGKKGVRRAAREYGKFAETLMELFSLADRYYGDPIRDLMLPFQTVPPFLDRDTLSPLITHGPEGAGQLLLGLYRDYFVAFVTPRDVEILTDYMKSTNQARRTGEDMVKKTDRVLNVLEKLNPMNKENDLHWFANQLKDMSERDDSFDIEGERLQHKRIDELIYNRSEHRTTYHTVLAIIYQFSSEFEKNPHLRNEIRKFKLEYKQQSDTKLASVEERSVLASHDAIRKMLGKPVYYNECQTDNIDDIIDTIDIIKADYNIDMTSHDIIGIVEEFNAFDTIAKKFGTNNNIVYRIKAMYR